MNKRTLKIISVFTIFLLLICLIVSVVLCKKNKNAQKNIATENFNINYDTNWKVTNSNDENISFKHTSMSAQVEYYAKDLEVEFRLSEVSELSEDIINQLAKQNPSYKLIAKENTVITKNEYDAIKLLYELEDNQILVVFGKTFDKMFFITYTAPNEEFDIGLDNFYELIWNSKILEKDYSKEFDKKYIETTSVNLEENTSSYEINDTKEYEVFSERYCVKYEMPDIFYETKFDTSYNYFEYNEENNYSNDKIQIDVTVLSEQISDYIEEVKGENSYREEDDGYSDIKFECDTLEWKNEAYICKNSYTFTILNPTKYEEVSLIYALDDMKIFIVEIESTNLPITQELINSIRIVDFYKYGEHIYKNEDETGNNYINTMKSFIDYNYNEYYNITCYTPKKYDETDFEFNKYDCRYYYLNDEEYFITVRLNDIISAESDEEIANEIISNYNEESKLSFVKDISSNGNKFQYYIGSNNQDAQRKNVGVLFLKLENNFYYSIEIESNSEISKEMLLDFTNIKIEKLTYER